MDKNVQVPRDLSNIKPKILFGLTARQLICFGLAAAVGLPLYFLIKKVSNPSIASLVMIVVMLPFFFFGLYEKDGMPPEVYFRHLIDCRFRMPRKRVYKKESHYRIYACDDGKENKNGKEEKER